MTRTLRRLLRGVSVGAAVMLMALPAFPQKNPDRDAFFGQTHSHTSWSVDAYLIGNHLTTPEDAYKYSLGMPVKHPAGFEVQLKGRPLDFHGVTDHSEYAGVISLANDPTSALSRTAVGKRLQAKTPAEFNAANAFWSVTMYDGKTQLLVENPLNRYLINSPMLPDMKKNKDGSLALYIQKNSPGKDKESNWLPAPNGPIYLVMRLYSPKPEPPSILPPGSGTWQPPAIQKAG